MKRALAITAALLAIVSSVACVESSAEEARETTGADPQSGRNKIVYYGCGSCH